MADWERLRQILPQVLGAAGGLSGGSNAFAKRWAELEEMDRRQKQQAAQAQVQQEQLGFQRDANTRAQAADQRAQQDQLLQTVNSVRGFLGDESIDTPEAYTQREQMMLGLAPRMGVDAGFIQSLRPAPTVYQQRAAKKKLAEIAKTYSPAQMQMLEADDQTGAAPLFEVNGEKLTMAQLRERVGTQAVKADGTPVSMRPPAATDKRGFTTKDVTVNGKRMLAGFDPDTNQYYAPGDTKTPLTGTIVEYQKPDASNGGPNPRMDARIDRIVNSFNSHPIVKEYNEVQSQQGIIQSIVNSRWSGPGDMAAVFAFMKALDPNSVVRETEYANAAKSGNIFQGWAARFNGAINPDGGFLSERVKQDFLRTINARMTVKGQQYQNLRNQLKARIDRIKSGAPETGDEALVDYSGGATTETTPRVVRPSSGNPFRRPNAGPR